MHGSPKQVGSVSCLAGEPGLGECCAETPLPNRVEGLYLRSRHGRRDHGPPCGGEGKLSFSLQKGSNVSKGNYIPRMANELLPSTIPTPVPLLPQPAESLRGVALLDMILPIPGSPGTL